MGYVYELSMMQEGAVRVVTAQSLRKLAAYVNECLLHGQGRLNDSHLSKAARGKLKFGLHKGVAVRRWPLNQYPYARERYMATQVPESWAGNTNGHNKRFESRRSDSSRDET